MSGIRFALVVALAAWACSEARGGVDADTMPEGIAPFGVPAERMVLRSKHLFVSSGRITVRPNVKALGFGGLFTPPFLANPAEITLALGGQPIDVADYTWYPSEVILHGKPTVGLDVRGRVVPLADAQAVVLELHLANRSNRTVSTELTVAAQGGVGVSDRWPFSPPRVREGDTKQTAESGRLLLRSNDGRAELALGVAGDDASVSNDRLRLPLSLRPGEEHTYWITAVLDAPGKTAPAMAKVLASPERFLADARANWRRRIERLEAVAPKLETPNAELAAFYRRALLTFLTCRWDSEAMLFRPWYATCGIDGGAMCAYLWDLSYTSKMAILCDAAAVRRHLLAFAQADLTEGNAVHPLDGTPIGNRYNYNDYNFARLAYDYVTLTGDASVLAEKIRGETFLDYLYRFSLRSEDLSRPPELIDQGVNKNLLELKKTDAYQRFTPSPNGERVLIFSHLTDLFSMSGRKTPHDLTNRAKLLRKRFNAELWDAEHRWFRCRDEQGRARLAYSIQIFDLLRTGILSPEQEQGVLSHLNEREFLGPFGLHSLSKLDEGYDPNDVDWGGPGAYVGDPTELVVDLIAAGYDRQGVDLLRRILWWGELPYIPQAVLADRRDYRVDGRANVIAGLSGGQAVLNGLLGIRVDAGQIHFRPVNDPIVAGLRLSNLTVRGRRFSLEIDAQGKTYTVRVDGQFYRRPVGSPLTLPLPPVTENRGRENAIAPHWACR